MNKMPEISKRGEQSPFSPIRKLVSYADLAKAGGVKVYHLNIGQPDFKVPPKIREEIKKLTRIDYLPYADSQGDKTLLLAWQKYLDDLNIKVGTKDIAITTGGSEALIMVMAAICDPDDEIIVFEPYYSNYFGFANLVSVKIVPVALDQENGYHLPSEKEIVNKISSKTRAIFLTNPNNPTGTVFTKLEIELIIKIVKEHNLFICSDEAYLGITFDHTKSYSLLQIISEKDRNRAIVVDSLSKRLNVCGARIGAIVSTNEAVMSAINRQAQARLSTSTLEQQIVASQLCDSLDYVEQITSEYQKRRDIFISTLEKELGIKIHRPEGAFYTMVRLPIDDADDFAKWLLTDFRFENQTVMVAPGSGFYATPGKGKNEIRVAYVLKEADLEVAAIILAKAVKEYQTKNH